MSATTLSARNLKTTTPAALARRPKLPLSRVEISVACLILTVVAVGEVSAQIVNLGITPPTSAGTDGIRLWPVGGGPSNVVAVPLNGTETAQQKINKIIAAIPGRYGAVQTPGNRIRLTGVREVVWLSNTGETDGVFGTTAANGQARFEGQPSGQDALGNPALYTVEFGGPGFHTQALLQADQLPPIFDTSQLLGGLHADLLNGLPPQMQPALHFDPLAGLLAMDSAFVAPPNGEEYFFIAGTTDIGMNSEVMLSNLLPMPICDFDGSGGCDVQDLNALLAQGPIFAGVPVVPGVNEQFDLNGDAQIDLSDRDVWLSEAALSNGFPLPYHIGDANLDGNVDVSDLNLWNTNKFTQSLHWNSGNFNGNLVVDVADFNLWNANKFSSSNGVGAVPEPTSLVLLLTALVAIGGRRKVA